MKIRNALIVAALIAAPIASTALVYYGPIWFLKAEIGQATGLLWKWMVRAYGVTPAMEDCLDEGGYPPNDYYFLTHCGGGWLQPPRFMWQRPSEVDPGCWSMFLGVEDGLISLAVDASPASEPTNPTYDYWRPAMSAQARQDTAEAALDDLEALNSCLQGQRTGGDLHRDRGR